MADLGGFVNENFVQPIAERTGYNAVNTLAYAAIAILGLYAVYRVFRAREVKFDSHFVSTLLLFVLLGSTVRVITDSVDSGVLEYRFAYETNEAVAHALYFVLNSHIYDYGMLTVTPGIYVVIALLFVCTVLLFHEMRIMRLAKYVPAMLLAPNLLLALALGVNWAYAALILALAAVAYFVVKLAFGALKVEMPFLGKLAVFSQALDGAATFVAIDLFPKGAYFEQHVLSRALGGTELGFGLFFALKVLLAAGAVYIVGREKAKQEEKDFILLAVIVMGLAPGMRDLLRLLIGT
ncbi:Uncharacterised protein [Candidatus Anstonella stagnisolia]|nr:Uncharacterised protein [Candidatus Anstonella stagnisolia]